MESHRQAIISTLALRVLKSGGNEMNCSVCGNPLLLDRIVFHCSCGAFVHAYCWDKHMLQAHKPAFEIGTVDLNDTFKVREQSLQEGDSE